MGAETDSTTEVLVVDPAAEQHDEPQKTSPDAWIWDGVMDLANSLAKVDGRPPIYPKVGRVPFTRREKCDIVMYALCALVIMVLIGLGTAFFITLAVTEKRGTSIFDEPQVTFHGLNGDGQPYMTHRFAMQDVARLVCLDGCNSAPYYFPGFDAVYCTLKVYTDAQNHDYDTLDNQDDWNTRSVLLNGSQLARWTEDHPEIRFMAWRCEWPASLEVYIDPYASKVVCEAPEGQRDTLRVWTQTCALYYSVTFD